ncbi:MAG: aldehyde ferredoxin oxidoreductase C-terminal domain-containing protein, partial [Candidatus Geothermarchaeales archaeon]
LRRSEAVYNVTRAINVAHGISRKDDYPPGRNFIDPVKSGPRKGALLTREEYEKLLDTYYELRGWDKTTGIPTAKKLEELGIGDVVKGLKKLGFDLGG